MNNPTKYDVIVVGAGHAGCEAALATARMGLQTLLLTIRLDTIAQMSCNPAIGGLAKGQLVREIDALGGEMARAIDATGIQFRMLNTSKGPAVQSPRAQADKKAYQLYMRKAIESQSNIHLKQEMTEEIITKDNKAIGVRGKSGDIYYGQTVILTTGTFMKGLIHIGEKKIIGGRINEASAEDISDNLRRLGFEVCRLKTGTPPRIKSQGIDYSRVTIQPGDAEPQPFSYRTESLYGQSQIPCYITYTNPETHKIIRQNLDRAPLYTGQIKAIGPRYCPSIEDKVVRFARKTQHQIFLEPEGRDTDWVYCNGIATSLPVDVQEAMIHSIKGLENAEIIRYGYAIEYDFVPSTQLKPTLETKIIENLYHAGQINGTSGYEEAAAQGLMAGINAALKIKGKPPLILSRAEAYIGVLIDDLVTLDIKEPYRMFTSRAEYRLLLRADNADRRLMPYGYALGLISSREKKRLDEKERQIAELKTYLENTYRDSKSLAQLLKQPEMNLKRLTEIAPELVKRKISTETALSGLPAGRQVEIEIKYGGYIQRQLAQIERFKKQEHRKIPTDIDYIRIEHLRHEARQKLNKVKPISLGQASRIAGVTPADISVLMVYLRSIVPTFVHSSQSSRGR